MGSKTIAFLGILLSALYLYFCINRHTVTEKEAITKTEAIKKQIQPVTKEKKNHEIVPPIQEETVSNQPVKENDSVVEVEKKHKRISTPAFGFMGGDKNQIVALMSDRDKNGILAKKIDDICKEKDCSKDMRYADDVKDYKLQEETAKIVDLIANSKIENGSVFLESGILKIEGNIKDKESSKKLEDILNSLKGKIKIENRSKNEYDSKEATNTIDENKPTIKEEKVERVEKTEEKSKVINNTTIKKEHKKVAKKIKHKTIIKHKKVVKDMVAPAHMETTLDAEERVREILDEMKDEATPKNSLVAKPHMETTIESNE